ncbi:MAG: hypothetical protein OXL36_02300, partial [Bryobacterales bacterium]|nr:hypothetical protein [Bryobacterales bacterium]
LIPVCGRLSFFLSCRSLFFLNLNKPAGGAFRAARNTAIKIFHETRITAFVAVRFAVGAQGWHNQKPSPERCNRRPVTASLPTIAHHVPAKNIALRQCPCPVSRSRWASGQAPFAAANAK